jgi:integrase
MRQHLKHIKTTRKRLADGSTRVHYYHRKTNKKIDGELGTPEFLASYVKASEPNKNRATAGTFHALVESYFQSSAFNGLMPRTQRDYRQQSNIVLDGFAHAPLGALEDKRIRGDFGKWRNKLAKTSPRQADYALAFLSCVLSHACDTGVLGVNYAKGLGRICKSNRTEKIWEDSDVEAFLRHATPEMALALRLALDTAQRQGDLIRLAWGQFRGGSD